jgi:hypothetical protein
MTDSDRPESTAASPIPVVSPQAIEQYKAKLYDLGNIGSRQTAMTTYYVSIISALFGVLAFKEKSLAQIDTIVLFMICGAGTLICILWFHSLSFFRGIFRAKLRVLEEIEMSLPFQTFRREFENMKSSGVTSWIWIERMVPAVFAAFFLVVIAVRVAVLTDTLQP